MADFAEGISDGAAGRRLSASLQGKGAFRRFKNEMYQHHPELISVWQAMRDARARAPGCPVAGGRRARRRTSRSAVHQATTRNPPSPEGHCTQGWRRGLAARCTVSHFAAEPTIVSAGQVIGAVGAPFRTGVCRTPVLPTIVKCRLFGVLLLPGGAKERPRSRALRHELSTAGQSGRRPRRAIPHCPGRARWTDGYRREAAPRGRAKVQPVRGEGGGHTVLPSSGQPWSTAAARAAGHTRHPSPLPRPRLMRCTSDCHGVPALTGSGTSRQRAAAQCGGRVRPTPSTEPTLVSGEEPLAAAKSIRRRMLSRWKLDHFLRLHLAPGV